MKLSDLKASELKQLAKKHKVEGYTSMNKADLVKALSGKADEILSDLPADKPSEPVKTKSKRKRILLSQRVKTDEYRQNPPGHERKLK